VIQYFSTKLENGRKRTRKMRKTARWRAIWCTIASLPWCFQRRFLHHQFYGIFSVEWVQIDRLLVSINV